MIFQSRGSMSGDDKYVYLTLRAAETVLKAVELDCSWRKAIFQPMVVRSSTRANSRSIAWLFSSRLR